MMSLWCIRVNIICQMLLTSLYGGAARLGYVVHPVKEFNESIHVQYNCLSVLVYWDNYREGV